MTPHPTARHLRRWTGPVLGASVLAVLAALAPARAETLAGALAKAYQNNPSINAVRAAQRALDEGVAIAKSGYRPQVGVTLDYGISSVDGASGGPRTQGTLSVNQTLFDGFRRKNAVRSAKAGVFAGQEDLAATEQSILLSAVQAYVAVIQNQRIVGLLSENVSFLEEQLRASNARFEVGEGTRTDVAQARADRAAALGDLEAARANLRSSEALYLQIVGSPPTNLQPARIPARSVPHTIDAAVSRALSHNPAIRRAQFLVEQASFDVKRNEGAFLPTLTGTASATRTRGAVGRNPLTGGSIRTTTDTLSAGVQLSVPLYQGGAASAQVRQSKELLSQSRIQVDVARRNVREATVRAFSDYQAALASRTSVDAQIAAAQEALRGLIEERSVGQRTTLDVLLGRQTLVNAQILRVQNEAQLVAAGYGVLNAMGKLSVRALHLPVREHEPDEHYVAVKDKWYGLRTPDQR